MVPERRDEGDAKTLREPKRLATAFPLRARQHPPLPQGTRSFEGTRDSPEASRVRRRTSSRSLTKKRTGEV